RCQQTNIQKETNMFPSPSVRQQAAAMQRQLLARLPKKLRNLASFGVRAFVLTPFVSCNAKARIVGSGTTRHAAEMRMCRLLRHVNLASQLMATVQQALPLNVRSTLNVDFSNFGGVAVLAAALQTGQGRAIPWAFEALVSNTQGYHTYKPGYQRHKLA